MIVNLYRSPEEAFYHSTKYILKNKIVYNFMCRCSVPSHEDSDIKDAVAFAFNSKKAWKHGKEVFWPEWLGEGVFSQKLYEENGCSLLKLLQDDRFFHEPTFTKHNSTHSMIGRMSRERESFKNSSYKGFLDYTIGRWKKGGCRNDYSRRSMPHFYFDVEQPEWIWSNLAKNDNMPKCSRTSVSCMVNVGIRWNKVEEKVVVTLIFKHNQWSHLYGDFCGGANFVRAFEKEVGSPSKTEPELVIFAISSTLDEKRCADETISLLGGLYE